MDKIEILACVRKLDTQRAAAWAACNGRVVADWPAVAEEPKWLAAAEETCCALQTAMEAKDRGGIIAEIDKAFLAIDAIQTSAGRHIRRHAPTEAWAIHDHQNYKVEMMSAAWVREVISEALETLAS